MPIFKEAVIHIAFILSLDIYLHLNPPSFSTSMLWGVSLLSDTRPSPCTVISIPIYHYKDTSFGNSSLLTSFLFSLPQIIPSLYYFPTKKHENLQLLFTSPSNTNFSLFLLSGYISQEFSLELFIFSSPHHFFF